MLAHELSHVAHRDVLVMTIASSAGIAAGMLTRGAQFGGMGRSRRSNNNGGAAGRSWSRSLVSLVVYAVSFVLLRAALALPRALRRPVGRLPDDEAGGARLGPAEDQRRVGRAIPHEGPARGQRGRTRSSSSRRSRGRLRRPDGHPPAPRAAARAARPDPGRARAGRRLRRRRWDSGRRCARRTQPKRNNLDALFLVPSAAITLQTALGFEPTGVGSVCYRSAAGAAFAQTQAEVLALIRRRRRGARRRGHPGRLRLHLAGRRRRHGRRGRAVHRPPRRQHHARGAGLRVRAAVLDGARSPTPSGRRFGLVYLYKQGTFYPFAPTGDAAARQRCWSCPCATCSRPSCPWSRTCSGGWRSGRLRGCEGRGGTRPLDRGVRRPRRGAAPRARLPRAARRPGRRACPSPPSTC